MANGKKFHECLMNRVLLRYGKMKIYTRMSYAFPLKLRFKSNHEYRYRHADRKCTRFTRNSRNRFYYYYYQRANASNVNAICFMRQNRSSLFRFCSILQDTGLAYVLLKFTIIMGARAIFATINDAIVCVGRKSVINRQQLTQFIQFGNTVQPVCVL